MTQYKTITLELIRDQPELYERLRSTKRLLPAMDAYAIDLKTRHDAWKEAIARQRPGSHPSPIASEALELAIEQLQAQLQALSPSGSSRDEAERMIDAAMASLRRPTPLA
jgi:hypothetical protein